MVFLSSTKLPLDTCHFVVFWCIINHSLEHELIIDCTSYTDTLCTYWMCSYLIDQTIAPNEIWSHSLNAYLGTCTSNSNNTHTCYLGSWYPIYMYVYMYVSMWKCISPSIYMLGYMYTLVHVYPNSHHLLP